MYATALSVKNNLLFDKKPSWKAGNDEHSGQHKLHKRVPEACLLQAREAHDVWAMILSTVVVRENRCPVPTASYVSTSLRALLIPGRPNNGLEPAAATIVTCADEYIAPICCICCCCS
jgi:hypothetical protein